MGAENGDWIMHGLEWDNPLRIRSHGRTAGGVATRSKTRGSGVRSSHFSGIVTDAYKEKPEGGTTKGRMELRSHAGKNHKKQAKDDIDRGANG